MPVNKLIWCKNCIAMSTRPRITFNEKGFCNACQWTEEKQKLDWNKRQEKLNNLLSQHRDSDNAYNCITTVSGGKDGSYVSYNLKHKHKMRPLAVTIRPVLETTLGNKNLLSFINNGYDHVHVSPNQEAMFALNKIGFIDFGSPYFGWLISIHTAVLRIAEQMKIPLIFYGEDGEVEYGGGAEYKNEGLYDRDYQKRVYMENGFEAALSKARKRGITKAQLYWFTYSEMNNFNYQLTHYGFYENWDPYRNYLVAKDKCGLQDLENTSEGSYTNFSQTDQKLYALHTYLMYLKFGFGRATQDASIDIRRGAMSREQAITLAENYDNGYPESFLPDYYDYFKMTPKEFDDVLDKHANKDLFEKKNRWEPKFKIK